MKNKLLLYLSVILVIIWMIVIFLFSSAPSDISNNNSTKISRYIVEKIYKNKSEKEIEKLALKVNKPLRKIAHASVYLFLSVFVNSVICIYRKNKLQICNIISITFCFIYACTDEFHQMFVENRSPLITDILIDTLGAIIGCLIFNLLYKVNKKY